MKKKLFFVGAMLVVNAQIFAQQEEKETQIDEVTIAGKFPQQVYQTGKNVKLLTSKDLEKYKGQNLNDVLNELAGFQITGSFNNQPEPKSMKIRGGKSANVLILLDGIPMKDVTGNDYNAADLRLFALENVESIEVLNGASSVLYGSNATVSVINIKTRKNSQKKIEGLLSARGGSYSTFAQNALLKGKLKDFNWQVSGFNEKSEGISAAEGDNFDKDGFEKQNINGNLGWTKDNFSINLNSGWNHHLFDYDTGAFADGTQRGNDQQFFIGGNAGYKYNRGNIMLNLRKSNNQRLLQDLAATGFEDQYRYKGNDFFTEIYNNYQFSDFVNVIAGFQYEKQSMEYAEKPWGGTALEDVLKSDETYASTYDFFANANFRYQIFHLDAGTRMTNHSKFGNHWVYSVNPYILKEIETLYFKLGYSYATAFVAPTLYQNFGALPYVLPNFDLKPETNESHEIDLSMGNKERTLNFTASLFQRNEKDVFAYQITDFTTYVGKFINVDENKVKGFEIGIDYQLNDMLKLGGNFSFVEKDKAETMLRQPKQRVNSYLELLPIKSTRINLSHIFVSARDDAYFDMATFTTKKVVNDAYHLFNLNVNQKISPSIETYLNVGNLFNTSYVDVAGFTTKPRNYTLGLSYRF